MGSIDERLVAAVDLIPRLRRHARLLSGSAHLGDEYVRICLELIAAEPRQVEDDPLPLSLFRAFHVTWSRIAGSVEEAGRGGNDPAARLQRDLAGLPSLQRRALLLQVVEGFTPEQVAQILDLEVPLVRALVAEARAELTGSRMPANTTTVGGPDRAERSPTNGKADWRRARRTEPSEVTNEPLIAGARPAARERLRERP